MSEKVNRNLDGCYFRIRRDGNWCNVCFSDLAEDERDTVTQGKSVEWLKRLCEHLADQLADIGEQLDITGDKFERQK